MVERNHYGLVLVIIVLVALVGFLSGIIVGPYLNPRSTTKTVISTTTLTTVRIVTTTMFEIKTVTKIITTTRTVVKTLPTTIPRTTIGFYIYGSYGCPHCRTLKSFLEDVFGRDAVYYCSIDNPNSVCTHRFWQLIQLLNIPAAVPLTIVIEDGVAKAVVLGEVRDSQFWTRLVKHNESKVLVYIGKEFKGYADIADPKNFAYTYALELFATITMTRGFS